MKPVYIASFHQSKFGKLMGMTVPQIVDAAIQGACRQIGTEPAALDVGSIGAACNFSLNEQGLLAGLMADTPGLEGKPIEAVENACASGGQAVLSVIQKLQLGMGDTGIAVGYEKMRDAEGKMDGKLIGKVLGYFSYPGERAGKVFVFPHIFAEVMREYMDAYGVTEARSGGHRGPGICQRAVQSVRADEQGADHAGSGAQDRGLQSLRGRRTAAQNVRLLADHRRLRLADPGHRRRPGETRCSEIRVRGDRGMGTGHRPPSQGRPRRAASGGRVPRHAHGVPDGAASNRKT